MEQNFDQARRIFRLGQEAGAAAVIGMAICFVCPTDALLPSHRGAQYGKQMVVKAR